MTPETTKTVPSAKDDFFKKMEAQSAEWDAQLALWGAKAHSASEEIKADFHKWQRQFHDKRGEATKKLDALRAANHEAWEEVKTGFESAWTEVKSAFESARKKFN